MIIKLCCLKKKEDIIKTFKINVLKKNLKKKFILQFQFSFI